MVLGALTVPSAALAATAKYQVPLLSPLNSWLSVLGPDTTTLCVSALAVVP